MLIHQEKVISQTSQEINSHTPGKFNSQRPKKITSYTEVLGKKANPQAPHKINLHTLKKIVVGTRK